jgi:hypothetical protein
VPLLSEKELMVVATCRHQRNVSAMKVTSNPGRIDNRLGQGGRNPGRGRSQRGRHGGRYHGGRGNTSHASNVTDRS